MGLLVLTLDEEAQEDLRVNKNLGHVIQDAVEKTLRKSDGLIILGCVIFASRKSLSPVNKTSALATIDALKIGLSFVSRINSLS